MKALIELFGGNSDVASGKAPVHPRIAKLASDYQRNVGLTLFNPDLCVAENGMSSAPELGTGGLGLSDFVKVFSPETKEIYRSKESYLRWLKAEYEGHVNGMEFLMCPRSLVENVLEDVGLVKRDEPDLEFEAQVKANIETLKADFREEVGRINMIPGYVWRDYIASNANPGVALAYYFGAEREQLLEDFSGYASLQLAGCLNADRTFFVGGSGPTAWEKDVLNRIVMAEFEAAIESCVGKVPRVAMVDGLAVA